jgi:hypothetical protein
MADLARLFKARGGMLRSDEESILEPRGLDIRLINVNLKHTFHSLCHG